MGPHLPVEGLYCFQEGCAFLDYCCFDFKFEKFREFGRLYALFMFYGLYKDTEESERKEKVEELLGEFINMKFIVLVICCFNDRKWRSLCLIVYRMFLRIVVV